MDGRLNRVKRGQYTEAKDDVPCADLLVHFEGCDISCFTFSREDYLILQFCIIKGYSRCVRNYRCLEII